MKSYKTLFFSLCLISSLFAMEPAQQVSSARWKEIEEGTLIGKLPVELRQELGKFRVSQFDKEIDLWLKLDFERNARFYTKLFFDSLVKFSDDPAKKRYAIEKLTRKLNEIFANRIDDYLTFLESANFDWLVAFFKYAPRQLWYPLLEKDLKDDRGGHILTAALQANVLSKEDLLNISKITPNSLKQSAIKKAIAALEK